MEAIKIINMKARVFKVDEFKEPFQTFYQQLKEKDPDAVLGWRQHQHQPCIDDAINAKLEKVFENFLRRLDLVLMERLPKAGMGAGDDATKGNSSPQPTFHPAQTEDSIVNLKNEVVEREVFLFKLRGQLDEQRALLQELKDCDAEIANLRASTPRKVFSEDNNNTTFSSVKMGKESKTNSCKSKAEKTLSEGITQTHVSKDVKSSGADLYGDLSVCGRASLCVLKSNHDSDDAVNDDTNSSMNDLISTSGLNKQQKTHQKQEQNMAIDLQQSENAGANGYGLQDYYGDISNDDEVDDGDKSSVKSQIFTSKTIEQNNDQTLPIDGSNHSNRDADDSDRKFFESDVDDDKSSVSSVTFSSYCISSEESKEVPVMINLKGSNKGNGANGYDANVNHNVGSCVESHLSHPQSPTSSTFASKVPDGGATSKTKKDKASMHLFDHLLTGAMKSVKLIQKRKRERLLEDSDE